jgi:hypothetical protein
MTAIERMSRSPWNFAAAVLESIISSGESGDLWRRGCEGRVIGESCAVGGAARGDVTLDGDGELGEIRMADDAAELLLASSMPAAVHLRHTSPLDQC